MPAEPLGPHDWDAELLAAVEETRRADFRRRAREIGEAALWTGGTIALCLVLLWACLIGF